MSTCPNYQISDATTCTLKGLQKFSDNYTPNGSIDYFTQYTQNNFNVLVSSNIKLYNNTIDKPTSKYTICDIDNKNNAYLNCSFQNNTPWSSYDNNKNTCTTLQTSLPVNFTSSGKIINKPVVTEYLNSPNEKYCENKWYDWFTIPNYHLGNGYYSSNLDIFTVATCYAPCISYQIPYNTNYGSVCVTKDKIYGGLYGNTIDYSPLALIMLLGSTDQDLVEHYKKTLKYNINQAKNFSIDLINSNILDNYFGNQNTNIYNLVNNAKIDIQSAVNKNILGNFTSYDLTTPQENIKSIKKNNFNLNLNYKSSAFSIPDANMQDVLYSANLLDPDLYLNTCYNIAKNTYNATINSYDLFNNDINTFYNNYNNAIAKLSSFKTEKEKNNYVNNNFNIYYRICYLFNLNLTIPIQYDKIIKLGNIFKKASNICFDNKSQFSIYLFNQITINGTGPILYDSKYFDQEYDKCSANQYSVYNTTTNKYICKNKQQCNDNEIFNNITEKCEKIDKEKKFQNCSGNKLNEYIPKETINTTKLPFNYDIFSKFNNLMYILFWILIILFILLILVIYSELFGDLFWYIYAVVINFIYTSGEYIIQYILAILYYRTGSYEAEYKLAKNDEKLAEEKLKKLDKIVEEINDKSTITSSFKKIGNDLSKITTNTKEGAKVAFNTAKEAANVTKDGLSKLSRNVVDFGESIKNIPKIINNYNITSNITRPIIK